MKKKRACFFAAMREKIFFNLSEFLAYDIRILEEIGFEVVLANKPWSLPLNCDLYYAWHWLYTWPVCLTAKLLGKPFITPGTIGARHEDLTIEGYHRNKSGLEKFSHKILFNFSDAVISTSEIEYEFLRKLKVKSLFYVPACVDLDIYRPPTITKEQRRDQIITVSHLKWHNVERKRIPSIIQSMPSVIAKYPNMEFVIIGSGDPDKVMGLEQLAESLEVRSNLKMTGSISREEKISFFQNGIVYLQPTSYEGFGVSIAEAMSCGLPVIVSPNGAVPEVVGESGYYLDDDAPETIADSITRLIEDTDLWRSLSLQGRERISQKFSYENRKKAIEQIVNTTMS